MKIELINTGSELMLGFVLNTHQQWLCRQLADRSYVVSRQVAVPDIGHDIQQAVREALARADLVITTGGLGPTSDDITRDLIAQLLGKPLREDAAVRARIENFFRVIIGDEDISEAERKMIQGSGLKIELKKPHPFSLLEAARRITPARARCAYVGDIPDDIRAANAAKREMDFISIGCLAVAEDKDSMRKEFERVGADMIVDHPDELVKRFFT